MIPNFLRFEIFGGPRILRGPLGIFKIVQNGAQNEQETITYIVKRAKVESYQVLQNSAFNLVGKYKGFRVKI